MRTYVTQSSGGAREYVPNSAIPQAGGVWSFWTRPAGGGKAREERAPNSTIRRARHES
jgi:hypothetical protein